MRHDSSGGTPLGGEHRYGAEPAGALASTLSLDGAFKRALDLLITVPLLLVLAPLILLIALAIRLESPGPAFYRCRRLGRGGRDLNMLKFRKMRDGAEGPALSGAEDERFTRLGAFLAGTKVDELPQLWHVLRGEMTLVGPRPEDPVFVELYPAEYEEILSVPPGMTGLSQLAFARESEILDPDDRLNHYVTGILPQKVQIDRMYAARRSTWMDVKILGWTAAAVVFHREVAVHRQTGQLNRRVPRDAVEALMLPYGGAS
jgi:lipopolysaccharide/colanic/teichoic acid biosynthesis glycosyltransferase